MGDAAMGEGSDAPARWLERAGAQHDVVQWAGAHDDWDALWQGCPRGDWMLAIALRRGAPAVAIVAACRDVAVLALDHTEGDERVALERALAAPSDAEADAIEARAEASVDPAHREALAAVALAVRGRAEDAPVVPALIAQAAAMDAADCGMSAAVSYVQRRSSELVRARITRV